MERMELIDQLKSVIQVNGHILGAATGSGLSSLRVIDGGADLILALSAGKYRQYGQSAFSGFFGYDSSNELVYEYARRELFPIIDKFPILFGLFAQDPKIHLYECIRKIKKDGFSGIINYPSVGLIDGKFRQALENADLGYEREIEEIRVAHFLGLFTIAYVFDEEQAEKMVRAGADAVCVHFGVSGGGIKGASRVMSLEMALKLSQRIFERIKVINPEVIRLVCGGPVQTPIDTQDFYQYTDCQGYIGGSAIERVPVERAIINTVRAFKSQGDFDQKNIISNVLNGGNKFRESDTGAGERIDYAEFLMEYIKKNYPKSVRLKDLSAVTGISVSGLSTLFKKKYEISFSEYLIRYRIDRAKEYLRISQKTIKEISILVGYGDYAQFSKIFKKYTKMSPMDFRAYYQ